MANSKSFEVSREGKELRLRMAATDLNSCRMTWKSFSCVANQTRSSCVLVSVCRSVF